MDYMIWALQHSSTTFELPIPSVTSAENGRHVHVVYGMAPVVGRSNRTVTVSHSVAWMSWTCSPLVDPAACGTPAGCLFGAVWGRGAEWWWQQWWWRLTPGQPVGGPMSECYVPLSLEKTNKHRRSLSKAGSSSNMLTLKSTPYMISTTWGLSIETKQKDASRVVMIVKQPSQTMY